MDDVDVEIRVSRRVQWGRIVAALILGLPAWVIWSVSHHHDIVDIVVVGWLGYKSAGYVLAWVDGWHARWLLLNDRIEQQEGWGWREQASVPYQHIRAVTLRQSMLERAFGVGDVGLEVSGGWGADMVLAGVNRPELVREEIQRRLNKRRKA